MYFLLFESLLRSKYNCWMTLILKSVYLTLLFKRKSEVFFLSWQSFVTRLKKPRSIKAEYCKEEGVAYDFFSNSAHFETENCSLYHYGQPLSSSSAIITDSGLPNCPVFSMRMLISERWLFSSSRALTRK